MNCIKCFVSIEIEGGYQFRQCDHYSCLKCLSEMVNSVSIKTIRCGTNSSEGKLKCGGFLNQDDIEYVVPFDVYNAYVARTSKDDKIETDDETEEEEEEKESETTLLVSTVTFAELGLSPEELDSGWGQIASAINELQKNENITFDQASSLQDLIPLWTTKIQSKCPICFDNDVEPGEGVILKSCFHLFCKSCISDHIHHCETAEVLCPFIDDDYRCRSELKPKEVENLVSKEVYQRHYEELSLQEVEKRGDAFHCMKANCNGFCFIDSDEGAAAAIFFTCPKCTSRNCSSCKVIHEGTCQEYKAAIKAEEDGIMWLQRRKDEQAFDARNRVEQRRNAEMSESMINNQLIQQNFMRCPRCTIPCYKFTGCNHVTCASCKLQFNWAGKEPSQFR